MSVTALLRSKYGIHAHPGQKVECPLCKHKTFTSKRNDSYGRCWRPECGFELGSTTHSHHGPGSTATMQPTMVFDLQPLEKKGHNGPSTNPDAHATGCTLLQYATAKKLPVEFLQSLQIVDQSYRGMKRIVIPYLDQEGTQIATRYRMALTKRGEVDDRFRWSTGAKLALYGLSRLHNYRKDAQIVLVEGESDCHTLWYHGVPALGIPGAQTWKPEWDRFLEGFSEILLVAEPDGGGRALVERMRTASFADKIKVVRLGDVKDPSDLHCANPSGFRERWDAAARSSNPLAKVASEMDETRSAELWGQCSTLASESDLLVRFDSELRAMGYVGDTRAARLVFLSLVSRVLDRPISLAIKGPSSSGKSFTVETTLRFFPDSAYHALTSVSETALAYMEEPLSHRMLIIYEAAGASSDKANYYIRTLLSEGQIVHETVEKTASGLRSKTLVKAGPTGFITTTTMTSLHAENETRLLSVPIADTTEQTRAVIQSVLEERVIPQVDDAWKAMHEWIALQPAAVTIPFAAQLAQRMSDKAVRMRRDVKTIQCLIKTHALLHQASRDRAVNGAVVATIEDYQAAYQLAYDLIAEGVGQAVSATVRETVEAVRQHLQHSPDGVMLKTILEDLGLDKSATSRRVKTALAAGYLVNLEEKRGKPMRLVLGDPLPEDAPVIPHPDLLHGCTVACNSQDIYGHRRMEDLVPPLPEFDAIISDPRTADDLREALIERAAIMQYDGGLSAAAAERLAVEAHFRRSMSEPPN